MNVIERNHSNREYNKLSALVNDDLTNNGYEVVNNWRLLHTNPLDIITDALLVIARQIDSSSIVSKRIKRTASIIPKIKKGYELTQIQDIGGCRAILTKYEGIELCIAEIQKSRLFSGIRLVDYIKNPKSSGYRSVHMICTFMSDDNRFNGLKIEIQLRTFVQHTWATALEVVDLLTNQNLKGGIGSEKWLRFFALFSAYQADKEKLPLPEGTPTDREDLIKEIWHLETSLSVNELMQGAGLTYHLPEQREIYEYYLLDCSILQVVIHSYKKDEYQKAFDKYLALEREVKETEELLGEKLEGTVIALVSVDNIINLKSAYPNYFSDTKKFQKDLKKVAKEFYKMEQGST